MIEGLRDTRPDVVCCRAGACEDPLVLVFGGGVEEETIRGVQETSSGVAIKLRGHVPSILLQPRFPKLVKNFWHFSICSMFYVNDRGSLRTGSILVSREAAEQAHEESKLTPKMSASLLR